MLAWLAPIIVFGLVVFVHELGHFLAAKSMGVYCPRFSIGFGPALWKRRHGETQYMISLLPLGGYVRMASRDDEAMAFLEGGAPERSDDEPSTVGASGAPPLAEPHLKDGVTPEDWDPEALVPFGPRPVPKHRFFESKRLPARLFILLAGVTMNVLLALVVNVGVYAGYGRPYLAPVVDSVLPGQPAQLAGMLSGDSIAAVAGQPVRTWEEVVSRVSASAGTPLALDVVRRDGTRAQLRVVPEATKLSDEITGEERTLGRIGAAARTDVVGREQVGLGESVGEGWTATWRGAGLVVDVVQALFAGRVGVENLGGPIAIARSSVQAARGGLENLLALIAFLSINVAVLNLLPIPILDGGQVLMNVAEAVKGSPFGPRTRDVILRVGLMAIALLFVVVMFNDLKSLVQGWLQ
ncbi:MAG TPA: RIP metalloprotease RseP [Gemmatimonadaceae bacterium]|nr:RIP metalloprotease RseP [Gemmatimonadaceae bacterium]